MKYLIVLAPFSVIDFPEGGGHFWVYMQYAHGLLQSGCDVYWLEAFRGTGDPESDRIRLAPFLERMERFGMGGKLILYPVCGCGAFHIQIFDQLHAFYEASNARFKELRGQRTLFEPGLRAWPVRLGSSDH